VSGMWDGYACSFEQRIRDARIWRSLRCGGSS
jgi:hypothetical protein